MVALSATARNVSDRMGAGVAVECETLAHGPVASPAGHGMLRRVSGMASA